MSEFCQACHQLLFRCAVLFFLCGAATTVLPRDLGAAEEISSSTSVIAQAIRIRLESGGRPVNLRLGDQPIFARSTVPDFYLDRFFEPAWTEDFRPQGAAIDFLDFLEGLAEEGLDPNLYHLTALEQSLETIRRGSSDIDILADFDLLMTDAFLLLVSHLQNGRINPESIDPEWQAKRPDFDPLPILQQALEGPRIKETLTNQLPLAPEYAGLRQALQKYRQLREEGGWPELPQNLKLRPGDEDPAVADLRRRLAVSDDYSGTTEFSSQTVYDSPLVEAVQKFQVRHGLTSDGRIGKNTLAALNVPVEERVRQIEVNLERWRWLPRDLGERFLLVNIAAFQLVLTEGGVPVMDMKVVVGKPYRRTPVFSGVMTYLVLNPYWNVPMRIAKEDLLPQIQKDPGFLAKMGFKIFRGWGAEATEIDPAAIDWVGLSKNNFPYHLRQEPGPANALGRIKFMFPNKYDVYLHDTPARELFQKESRTFSSGCIRLEKPLELAHFLLAGSRFGSEAEFGKALSHEKSLSVKLPKAIPVHLLYWTAWVDAEDSLHFRPDIYGRDHPLGQALATGLPVL